MLNDIASIELERVSFDGAFREHNRRIERTQAAGRPVRDKMDMRKLSWITCHVSSWRGLVALVNLLLRGGKVPGDICHLLASSRKFRIFLARSYAIANEKKSWSPIPVANTFAWILVDERSSEHTQRTGIHNVGIFNPVVRLRLIDDQRLEIQIVQTAVGNDKYLCVARQECLCRLHEGTIQCASILAGCHNVLRATKRLAVALHQRIDFRAGRKRKQTYLGWRDRPQIRLFLSQPVKKNRAL